MKLIKRLVAVVAVLVILLIVGVLAGVYFYINPIAKRAVEEGGTYALGVPTTLDSVNVGLFTGELSLDGFTVGSPAGFSEPHFLTLDSGDVAVSLASLRSDVITVPRLELDGIDVRLEKKDGKANYQVIIDNAQKVTGGGGGEPKPEPAPGSEKKLIINDLLIRDVTVHAQLVEGVEATKVTVPVKEIHLTDVGQTGEGVGGSGVTISELSGILVEVVLAAAVENGGNLLPADMLGDLKGQLGDLSHLKDMGIKAVSGLTEGALGDVSKKVDEAAGKLGEGVKDAADKAGEKIKEGLGGLIPGKKKEEEQKDE